MGGQSQGICVKNGALFDLSKVWRVSRDRHGMVSCFLLLGLYDSSRANISGSSGITASMKPAICIFSVFNSAARALVAVEIGIGMKTVTSMVIIWQ